MRITITIEDNIDPVDALTRVRHVIQAGRISKNNTMYCLATTWKDGIVVETIDYRKSDCFKIYKEKKHE